MLGKKIILVCQASQNYIHCASNSQGDCLTAPTFIPIVANATNVADKLIT
jgi:hypothetical protein